MARPRSVKERGGRLTLRIGVRYDPRPMKKRTATKKKSAAKPRAAKKSSAKASKPAPRAAAAPAARAQSYTPQPLKTDGWAPFRYPLQ